MRDDILLYTHPNSRNFGTDEGVVQEIRAIVDSGHTALKFDPFPHPNRIGAADDIYLDGGMSKQGEKIAAKLTARIREIAGPDIEILIDAHGRFNVPTAIRLCRSLEDAGQIDWFEEPVPVESYHALHQVREKVSAHISVGERLHTRWEILPILENRLTDYLMPDVTWTGGITELKKIATLAETFYIPVSPHDASGPINVVAGAHVMMSTPNFYRLETSRWDLSELQRLHHGAARQQRRSAEAAAEARPRDRDEHGVPARQRGGRVRRVRLPHGEHWSTPQQHHPASAPTPAWLRPRKKISGSPSAREAIATTLPMMIEMSPRCSISSTAQSNTPSASRSTGAPVDRTCHSSAAKRAAPDRPALPAKASATLAAPAGRKLIAK